MRLTSRAFTAALVLSIMPLGLTSGQHALGDEMETDSYFAEETSAASTSWTTASDCNCANTGSGCASCSPSPFAGAWCERPYLFGSVWGYRDCLIEDGITVNVNSTQFYQGVAAGGIEQNSAYAGRLDCYCNVNGQKAGLWEGFFVTLHAETRYGETVNSDTGAIMPVNTAMLFPLPSGSVTALTGVKLTQALSENFVLFGGKINLLDELVQPFSAGRGVDSFMNMNMAFPAAAARTVPYSTYGAGFAILKGVEPIVSMMVLDTNNTPTTSGFNTFFDNGVTIIPKLNFPVCVGGLPGHQSVWGTYSTGTYSNLQPTAYFDPDLGLVVNFGTEQGSWSVFYSADQALYVDPSNPKRSWGLFTNIGTADNGPSPIRVSANVGLGGSSLLASRPLDTFGIGYSIVRYSSPVRDIAPALLPIGNDEAIELFYNYAVTPWCHVTPDLQVVFPAQGRTLPPNPQSIDTALVLGLRAKIDF